MALSQADAERVSELLEAHPDWRTGQIRVAAGLDSKQLFAVKSLRDKLGVPEPDNGQAKAPRKPRGRPRKSAAPSERLEEAPSAADAFEDDGDDDADLGSLPTGKAGGPRLGRWKRASAYKSVLAPAMPQLVKAGATGIMQQTGRLTRNPMEPAEALGIVAPAARIGDRIVARYVRVGDRKMDPNTSDLIAIVFALAIYLLRLMVDSRIQQQRATPPPAQGPMAHVPVMPTMPTGADSDDLFSGSEPAAPSAAPLRDEPDAPPVAPRPAATREGAALAREGIAGPHAGPVDDSYWNSITPTNIGNYEAP